MTLAAFSALPHANTRRSACRRCKRPLARGEGKAWTFTGTGITQSPTVYLCTTCAERQANEAHAEHQAYDALTLIGKLLKVNQPLGFLVQRSIMAAFRAIASQNPDLAARRANEIANRIELGETFDEYQVKVMLMGGEPSVSDKRNSEVGILF